MLGHQQRRARRIDAPQHADDVSVALGDEHRLAGRREVRTIQVVRATARVRMKPAVERMVPIFPEQRQAKLDDRIEAVRLRLAHGDAAHYERPPPKRSWFGRRLGSGVARPYWPPSEREIFLRATSASSTSSPAPTDVAGWSSGASPTWCTSSINPGTTSKPLSARSARASSVTWSAPPSSNHMITSSTLTPPARSWKVASAARRITSRAIVVPPISSPPYPRS